MLLLVLFAFLGGVVTILSPCILPILPVVLSGAVAEGKRRPLGIVAGFVLSFSFFTLFLSAVVDATGLPADGLRIAAIVLILLFGISLVLPGWQAWSERLFSRLANRIGAPATQRGGFGGGLLVGFSIGLIWTPCVGPIMASVITLAITSSVSLGAVFVTFAYAFGTALPMLAIMLGGRRLLQRAPWLLSRAGQIQRGFGVVMILIAVALQFNLDRKFQTWVLETFPAYGTGLTQLEDNDVVRRRLDALEGDADASPLAPLLDKPAVSAEAEPEETLFNVATPVPAPELTGLQAWINRDPTTLAALRGQVVVVDFWTYSCINCIRTLPYLKTWHDKYADDGLVILGIHAPEFEFEKKLANVEQAVRDFDIAYPVAQDNDFATWRAYGNRYWPAKYFIDREGNIRHYHFGEGAYEESERVIQALLAEGAEMPTAAVEPAADPDYDQRQSPETYLGYWRAANFANALEARQDETMTYTYPAALDRNAWALNGDWEMAEKSLYSRVADAGLRFKFSAKEVYVVMGADTPATVTVTLDGAPLTAVTAGSDVENSRMSVGEYRLYRLIASDKFIEGGLLELSFPDGVELNAFTFGS